jgi:photosystem II stability/assembly factor-like uncharacterized protein
LAHEAAAVDLQSPPAWTEDAELLDVFFLDAETGWAAGQQGVIWHTSDGGANWTLQHDQRGCRLESVWFVDRHVGWAAGIEARPLPAPPRGVLLRTQDGGKTWRQEPKLVLPGLRRVRFFDRKHGIAAGFNSVMFPTGLMETWDGGQSWQGVALAGSLVCNVAHVANPRVIGFSAADGGLYVLHPRGVTRGESPVRGLREIRDLAITPEGEMWAVGDGGLVLHSANAGATWSEMEFEAAKGHAFDWSTVQCRGASIWIAGSPGSRLLHSGDGGRTWRFQETEQPLPINRLFFVDQRRGWAALPLGTILGTQDGGDTWRAGRAGSRRVAWLAIYSEPQALPAELVAKVAASQGYLGAARFLLRRDLVASPGVEREISVRSAQMLAQLGGCRSELAWRFPVRERGLELPLDMVTEAWSRYSAGDPIEQVMLDVAGAIRVWRPDVVFTHAADSGDPVENLIHQSVVKAVAVASNASDGKDSLVATGLPSWQVHRVYGTGGDARNSTLALVPAEVAPALGMTLEDYACEPRSIVAPRATDRPLEIGCDLILAQGAAAPARDFFAGLTREPRSDGRRTVTRPEDQTLDQLRRSAQHARNLRSIVELDDEDLVDHDDLVARLDVLIGDLPATTAARLIGQLADRQFHRGRWGIAVELYELLAARFPDQAAAALIRLIALRTSGEAYHRFRDNPMLLAGAEATSATPPVRVSGFEGVVRAAAVERSTEVPLRQPSQPNAGSARARLFEAALRAAKELERLDPLLYSAPSTRFALSAAGRHGGSPSSIGPFDALLARTPQLAAWQANAAAELWRLEPKGRCPKPSFVCARAARRPYLDGRLNDDAWQHAEQVVLKSPYRDDAHWAAEVRLAYDAEFVYLAARCETRLAPESLPGEVIRQHDAELARQDRLEIFLDLDRDYGTHWHFAVDQRGMTRDSCLGDASWNPGWFVARQADASSWTVEAAIPMAELCEPPPSPESMWAVGIQRVAPGMGFQSATLPASPETQPEGFGLLRFE